MQSLVEELMDIKKEITAKNKEVKDLKVKQAEIEEKLMADLDEMGLDQIRTDMATISVQEKIVPTVTDWDAFYAYILETGSPWMMERRASAQAFKDYLELHEAPPPGVEPFTKRTIATRKAG